MTNEETIKVLDDMKIKIPIPNSAETQLKKNEALDMAINLLEQIGWIPVSERLPEKDGFYLATCDGKICGNDAPFSWLAEFENGKWVADEDDYQCVLAWIPLPEPYKESEGKE